VWLDAQALEVDALQFEALGRRTLRESLERAVALYRGGAQRLQPPGEHFEQWMTAERRRFQEGAVQAFSRI
jgi:hypothetical protein